MTFLLFTLALLLAVNVLATRRVVGTSDDAYFPKRILIVGIWIMPFFGALIARMQTPAKSGSRRCEEASLGRPDAPLVLAGSGTADFSVADHLACVSGVPLLDWRALSDWAQTCDSTEATASAIDAGRRAWLLHLRDALGSGACLHVSDDVCILSTLEPRVVQATARYVSNAKRRICACARGTGPLSCRRAQHPRRARQRRGLLPLRVHLLSVGG
jgi:hypothetical protein